MLKISSNKLINIFVLIGLGLVVVITILILIVMIPYVATYSEMNSFMSLRNAIITVILSFLALIGAVVGNVLMVLKMLKNK